MTATGTLSMQTTVPPVSFPDPRKYLSPSTNQPFPFSAGYSNIDSIVEAAGGMSLLATTVGVLAQQVSSEIAATRKSLAMISLSPSSPSSPSVKPQMTEDDVSHEQNRITEIVKNNLPTLSSSMLNSNLAMTVGELVAQSRQQFMPIQSNVGKIDVQNRAISDLDSVSLQFKNGKGVGDSFFSELTFSIPVESIDSGDVVAIRIFRAVSTGSIQIRPTTDISLRGMGSIVSQPVAQSKNVDELSMLEKRFQLDGIPNALTMYNPIDRFTGQRIVTSQTTLVTSSADDNVISNPQFNDALRLQNPGVNVFEYDPQVNAGSSSPGTQNLGSAHLNDLGSMSATFGLVVRGSNDLGFKQIYVSTPSNTKSQRVGQRYYFTYDDESVVFGRQYKYYVETVNANMVQSNRSPIVTLVVDGMRVPANPSSVIANSDGYIVSLFVSCPDRFVEKFEIWKKNEEISNTKGFVVTTAENGFSFVDETVNGSMGAGAAWIDRAISPGKNYIYRVYSVDIFGNKSESPYEVHVMVPELSSNADGTLMSPSILAEVDAKTQKVVVIIRCDDENVSKLRLERRDSTIGQENYTVPAESARIIMGPLSYKHFSGLYGERVMDSDNVNLWNGWFDNKLGGITFVDTLAKFDRTYQYRVFGISKFGNKTSYSYSNPVLVYRKPMINSPVNISATLAKDSSGSIDGVLLSWQPANLDVSSESMLGSQFSLSDNSVKTLYQVSRQMAGDRWLNFSMISGTSFFDPVAGFSGSATAPDYRPPFLELNTEYNYRVQAVMSGGYISNSTQQLSVFVGNVVAMPMNFSLRTPDPHVRPFYVMLNWDTPGSSGVVDKWVINRAEVNNYAADRINSQNPSDFENVVFQNYRTIYSESSRFRSFWSDVLYGNFSSSLIVGQNSFMDADITFGNSYFYRIYAVDNLGNQSQPAYRGIKVTSQSYERMASEIYSTDEILRLTNSFIPVRPALNIFAEPPLDSKSLNPTFSTPNTVPVLRKQSS